jgi:hypothetical protein
MGVGVLDMHALLALSVVCCGFDVCMPSAEKLKSQHQPLLDPHVSCIECLFLQHKPVLMSNRRWPFEGVAKRPPATSAALKVSVAVTS